MFSFSRPSALTVQILCGTLVFFCLLQQAGASASSGTTFCVGVNVAGTDGRTLDTDVGCTVMTPQQASSSAASSEQSSDSGGGNSGNQGNESSEGDVDTEQGGRRGSGEESSGDGGSNQGSSSGGGGSSEEGSGDDGDHGAAPGQPTFFDRIIGIFRLRFRPNLFRTEEHEALKPKPGIHSSALGVQSSVNLSNGLTPQERSQSFWQKVHLKPQYLATPGKTTQPTNAVPTVTSVAHYAPISTVVVTVITVLVVIVVLVVSWLWRR